MILEYMCSGIDDNVVDVDVDFDVDVDVDVDVGRVRCGKYNGAVQFQHGLKLS